jgi:ribosomal protein S12 methylthiotransferase
MTADTQAPVGRLALLSLGCAKNLVDSERLVGALAGAGFALSESLEGADIALINTCGFIEAAKEESIETILNVARHKEFGRLRGVLVAGCLVERYREELAREIPEVDRWLGFEDYGRIVDAAHEVLGLPAVRALPPPRVLLTPSSYAYLKISEGCDQKCAFCAIPSFRGRLVSRTIEENVADARGIAERGVGEIDIVSQDTTAYGRDRYGKPQLVPLLRELTKIDGPRWWRLLYLYPTTLKDDVLDEIAANDRIAKYVDMPIQHVSDRMLKAMRRGISGPRQRALLERIRERIPGVALRTTVITGFPGETQADHDELMAAVRDGWFDRLGVFTYSPEEGTAAFDRPDPVPTELMEERRDEIMAAQMAIHHAANAARVGQEIEVLVERHEALTKRAFGRSEHDAPDVDGTVRVEGVTTARPGAILRVRVTASEGYDLVARPLAAVAGSDAPRTGARA